MQLPLDGDLRSRSCRASTPAARLRRDIQCDIRMWTQVVAVLGLASTHVVVNTAAPLLPSNLRVEGLGERDALGIDSPTPLFTWGHELSGAMGERGRPAPATTVDVHEISPAGNLLWSRSLPEGGTMSARYTGPKLRGASRYHWTVCAERACASSSFLTAPTGWGGAEWIAGRQFRSPKLTLGSKKI
eukprot:SAG31_NODE_6612_length_1953_cov_1.555016_2_plen_187_part_00